MASLLFLCSKLSAIYLGLIFVFVLFGCVYTVFYQSLRLDFIKNSRIESLTSINSKNSHINIFACSNINISHVRLTAPENSPNTDGIHIGNSTKIKISNVNIGTGDDCISMISGSQNIHISESSCGPGHGISVGSIGKDFADEYVLSIDVMNITFTNTMNGVRIKTYSDSSYSLASNIKFQNIIMKNVNNPIIIDQDYCSQCKATVQFPLLICMNYIYNFRKIIISTLRYVVLLGWCIKLKSSNQRCNIQEHFGHI